MTFLLLLGYALLATAFSQCSWTVTDPTDQQQKTLDLSCLASHTFDAVDQEADLHHYMYSVCRNSQSCNGESVMTKQTVPGDASTCYILGRWNSSKEPVNNDGGGWRFKYDNGDDDCGNPARTWAPRYICDLSTNYAVAPVTEIPNSCYYEVDIRTKYACLDSTPACFVEPHPNNTSDIDWYNLFLSTTNYNESFTTLIPTKLIPTTNTTIPSGSGSIRSGGGATEILKWALIGVIVIVVIGLCIVFGFKYKKKQQINQSQQKENLLMDSLNEQDIPGSVNVYDLLKKWSLQQYGKVLIEEKGYDDIEMWKDLNETDLNEMGFKEGHSKKFVKMVNEYFMDVLVETDVFDKDKHNDDMITEEVVEYIEENEGEGYTNQ